MLSISYSVFCSVEFEHSFYNDLVCRDIELIPTAATRESMDNHGLLLKSVSGKTIVLRRMEGNLPQVEISVPIQLSFMALIKNPALQSLFGVTGATRFHLTNLDQNGAMRNRLTRQDSLSSEDKLPVIESQRINFTFPKETFQRLEVTRFQKGGWSEPVLYSLQPESENFTINLQEPGKYGIAKHPGQTAADASMIIANQEARSSGPFWALVDLFADDTIPAGTRYRVTIPNRPFRFQYVFIDLASQDIELEPTVAVSGARHGLDVVNPNSFTFSNILMNLDTPVTMLEKTVAGLKKAGSKIPFAMESDTELYILENRPPSIGFNVNLRETSLPVPMIDDLRIIDNKAVVFLNI